MDYLLRKPDPLPQDYHDDIDNVRYELITERGEKTNAIMDMDTRRAEVVNLLLKNESSDSLELNWTAFSEYLHDRGDEMILQQLTDYYLGIKNLDTANNQLNAAREYVGLSEYAYINDNMDSYVKVKEYIIDTLLNNDGVIEELDSVQVDRLIELRDLNEGYKGGQQASNILCFFANICEPAQEIPAETKSALTDLPESSKENDHKTKKVILIPNPNKGRFVVQLEDGTNIQKVDVVRLDGRKVRTNAILDKDQAQVELQRPQTGVYFVRITDQHGGLSVSKFLVY